MEALGLCISAGPVGVVRAIDPGAGRGTRMRIGPKLRLDPRSLAAKCLFHESPVFLAHFDACQVTTPPNHEPEDHPGGAQSD
jgi:hypothetical protein